MKSPQIKKKKRKLPYKWIRKKTKKLPIIFRTEQYEKALKNS